MKKTFCEKKGLLKQIEEVVKRKKNVVFFTTRSNNVNKRVLVERLNETFYQSLKIFIKSL